ncbi:cation:proton antiporter [Saliphagus infecundisoli]|uniref:Cation:proton antiporter n=1 Tax=Saliphagus infecundisoli TaxID=1849069 RepID=A0ABD5QIK6_9EURY|nr:cation:proton antiporter [Saliphagus infecundisoli]
MSPYDVFLVIVALGLFGAIVLPRRLAGKPLSLPIVYVALGAVLFTVVPGAPAVDPVATPAATERLAELVVIVALMGAGLKIDRPFGLAGWASTWRLLAVAMPVTITLTALLGWGVLGLLPATAVLLGAVLAPTDPVLASDVEAGAPLTEVEEERAPENRWGSVRFSLTSEAGLNDGLAFPFTYLAIALAAATGPAATGGWRWLAEWALVDVGYRIAVGVLAGYAIGVLMARLVFGSPAPSRRAEVMAGAEALATTLLAYGLTELVGGYGFLAVFVAALALRRYEWTHEYHRELHDFAAIVERLLMAAVLVLFGGAVAGGLLAPLTPAGVAVALAILLVVRPLSGLLAFAGSDAPLADRAAVSWFGIRGVGSFYYLSFALAHASFTEIELLVAAERLWAVVGLVVLASIVLHGITASPAMAAIDRRRHGDPDPGPDPDDR